MGNKIIHNYVFYNLEYCHCFFINIIGNKKINIMDNNGNDIIIDKFYKKNNKIFGYNKDNIIDIIINKEIINGKILINNKLIYLDKYKQIRNKFKSQKKIMHVCNIKNNFSLTQDNKIITNINKIIKKIPKKKLILLNSIKSKKTIEFCQLQVNNNQKVLGIYISLFSDLT
jgi:hypothetical protein